jgi:hypothetical protein
MGVYKRGQVWWYRFTWRAVAIRESTKQTNKRVAEQIEAAHKTSLAKGEVGIRDRLPIPTVQQFIEQDFRPFVESRFQDKPKTLEYYRMGIKHLLGHAPLAKGALDGITNQKITGFVEKRRERGLQVSTINRQLEVLRRILKLAVEWGKLDKVPPKIEMLPGERHRDRVLSLKKRLATWTRRLPWVRVFKSRIGVRSKGFAQRCGVNSRSSPKTRSYSGM